MESTLNKIWGKIGREVTDSYATRHPLACHLVDVGVTASLLWRNVLRGAFKNRIAGALKLSVSQSGQWIAFWAAAHDIGKAAPGFQAKQDDALGALNGKPFDFTRRGDKPHATITTAVLSELLAQPGRNRSAVGWNMARRIAITLGGHHGLFPSSTAWNEDCKTEAVLGCGLEWDTARREMLDHLAGVFGLAEAGVPQDLCDGRHGFFLTLAGLVSVADWIGSNRAFFPHRPDAVDVASYAREAEGCARKALEDLGWLGWSPDGLGTKTFDELFRFSPRPLQDAAIAAANSKTGSTLTLIEAPMGEGKTEAALYLADRWTHQHGGQGAYVALPTMATSNQMFTRVLRFLEERYPGARINVQLLHGMAFLTEQFEDRLRKAEETRQGFTLADIDHGADKGTVVAESWFAANKKQAILAPFGVGTIDQALLSVVQVKHGFVRLFGLAGKTVILDEVHAYDTYMSTIMVRLLEWLAALGCSVVLLSATLPKDRRRALLRAWTGAEPPADDTPYPRLTVAAAGKPTTTDTFATDPERTKTIVLEWRKVNALAADLEAALAGGGCAAVIRNTVGEAQETFTVLRDGLRPRGIEVELFHARFPFEDRQRIETGVLGRFGKAPGGEPANANRPRKAVLVATQVIEQSLDLDFDLMVTDVAPVDLVLQRAGRLHRHARPDRPIPLPRLWLVEPIAKTDGTPDFGGSGYVYERFVLLKSLLVLKGLFTVNLPGDIDRLVEAVYGDDPDGLAQPSDEAWRADLEKSRTKMEADRSRDEGKAQTAIIESPRFEDDVLEVSNRDLIDDEDDPKAHVALRAATRLTEPSVQLVLLYRTHAGLSIEADGTGLVDPYRKPTLTEVRRLLGRAVTLQQMDVVKHFAGCDAPTGWQESAFLRYHRIAELDVAGCCPVGQRKLRLDPELGVVIFREDEGGIEA